MSDDADRALDNQDQHLAVSLSHIDATIPAGVAGECDECGETMPRLVGGRCGYCRDGRRPPLSRFEACPRSITLDAPQPSEPMPPTSGPPVQQPEEMTMPTAKPTATSRTISVPASGDVLKAIETRAAEEDLPLGRAAVSLLEDFLAHPTIKQDASAPLADLATLSQFPNGSYKGKLQPIAEAVHRYRQLLAVQAEIAIEMPEPPAFFMTETGRQIVTMLSIAQRGRMVVIAGGPGTSKTKTCYHYQASVSNVWIATMSPSTSGLAPMQYQVLKALGADEDQRKGSPVALTERIKSLLKKTGGLLIVDEAQHLTEKSLEEIRGWHDDPEVRIGVALVGNEDVLTRLTLGSRKDAFARLASRIAQRMIFRGPRNSDAMALADAWSIEAEDQRGFIVSTARQPGGLRTCTMMLETACMIAASESAVLSLSHMQDAWAHLSTRQLAA